MNEFQAAQVLYMKVWRDKVKEDPRPMMYVLGEPAWQHLAVPGPQSTLNPKP